MRDIEVVAGRIIDVKASGYAGDKGITPTTIRSAGLPTIEISPD